MERRKFTREFKLEAVRLIKDRGVSYVQASQDLGVHTPQKTEECHLNFARGCHFYIALTSILRVTGGYGILDSPVHSALIFASRMIRP
jgi:hypothetical protein